MAGTIWPIGLPVNTILFYEALCHKFGSGNVSLEQGVTYKPEGSYTEENERNRESC